MQQSCLHVCAEGRNPLLTAGGAVMTAGAVEEAPKRTSTGAAAAVGGLRRRTLMDAAVGSGHGGRASCRRRMYLARSRRRFGRSGRAGRNVGGDVGTTSSSIRYLGVVPSRHSFVVMPCWAPVPLACNERVFASSGKQRGGARRATARRRTTKGPAGPFVVPRHASPSVHATLPALRRGQGP
eukprot:364344-Chlamydomonas_euryale.AAC.1